MYQSHNRIWKEEWILPLQSKIFSRDQIFFFVKNFFFRVWLVMCVWKLRQISTLVGKVLSWMNGPFEIHFVCASIVHLRSKICKVKYYAVLPTLSWKCLFIHVTKSSNMATLTYVSNLTSNSIFWFGFWILTLSTSWHFFKASPNWPSLW